MTITHAEKHCVATVGGGTSTCDPPDCAQRLQAVPPVSLPLHCVNFYKENQREIIEKPSVLQQFLRGALGGARGHQRQPTTADDRRQMTITTPMTRCDDDNGDDDADDEVQGVPTYCKKHQGITGSYTQCFVIPHTTYRVSQDLTAFE